MTSVPTFCVVVPAYNSERTLERALDSLLAQTHAAAEIVVVDDGSTDGTAALAARYAAPVRLVRQDNAGTAAARNRGIAEATADVVCFLDSDDRYEPTRLESIAGAFAERPWLDGVLTDAVLVEGDRRTRASTWWPPAANRDVLDLRARIIFCALALRTQVLRTLGPFDSRFHLLEDVEMWNRVICNRYRIGYVDDPSYVYLINPGGKTQSAERARGEGELFRIQLRYALHRRTPNAWRPRLLARAGLHASRSLRARLGR